jgi:trans-2-enoyl-CoA reductase
LTTKGIYPIKPKFIHRIENGGDDLFAVGGNEGVARVLEAGADVTRFKKGDWVLPDESSFGTWRTHTVCGQEDVFRIEQEGIDRVMAATVAVNPCSAFRMIKDSSPFLRQSADGAPPLLIQNGSNSAVGQSVIQLAKAWGIETINIVRPRADMDQLKTRLTDLGASLIVDEEELNSCAAIKDKIQSRFGRLPSLALNCVGGKSATNMARMLRCLRFF